MPLIIETTDPHIRPRKRPPPFRHLDRRSGRIPALPYPSAQVRSGQKDLPAEIKLRYKQVVLSPTGWPVLR
jgi:hypothetical protein